MSFFVRNLEASCLLSKKTVQKPKPVPKEKYIPNQLQGNREESRLKSERNKKLKLVACLKVFGFPNGNEGETKLFELLSETGNLGESVEAGSSRTLEIEGKKEKKMIGLTLSSLRNVSLESNLF